VRLLGRGGPGEQRDEHPTQSHGAPTTAPLPRCEQIMTARGDHLSVTTPQASTSTPLHPTLQIMTSARVAAE
jgi:hypothetical protein